MSAARARVVDEAAGWLVRLHAGELDAAGRRALDAWRAQDAEHERAWQAAEALAHSFGSLPPGLGLAALDRPRNAARRALFKSLLPLLAVPAAGGLAWRRWGGALAADYRTAAGETRDVRLADGSRLVLATASAADVVFDGDMRRIVLHAGEILVHTAADATQPPRPFVVHTAEGRIRALGTRFTVRRDDSGAAPTSRVAVLEHAVEIQARDGGTAVRLEAGRQADFTTAAVAAPVPLAAGADAWLQGKLVADRQRLADFLAELARYRPGVLRCAPEVAELRISGVFQTADTDRVLGTLAETLPVAIRYRTRYWVNVEPRPPG